METNPSAKFLGFARLSDKQLAELSALEKDLGAVIIALQAAVPFATLTAPQASRLQQLEQRHGIVALACMAYVPVSLEPKRTVLLERFREKVQRLYSTRVEEVWYTTKGEPLTPHTSGLEIAPLPAAWAEELSAIESGEFAVVICLRPARGLTPDWRSTPYATKGSSPALQERAQT
jgi:hypothetical protein